MNPRNPRAFLLPVALLAASATNASTAQPARPVAVSQAVGAFAEPRPLEYEPNFTAGLDVEASRRVLPPAPLRVRSDADDAEAEPLAVLRGVIEHDLRTGRSVRSTSSVLVDALTRVTNGGLPDATVIREMEEMLKDYTGWFAVNPLTAGRSMNVRLDVQWMDEFGNAGSAEGGGCSGILIGPRHVLTAGHCVYSFEDNDGDEIDDFAISLQVFPATDGPVDPFGAANAVKFRVWTGWSDYEDLDYDIALIELDRPVGAIAGWSAIGTTSDCNFFESNLWVRDGYPGTPFDGVTMLEQVGDYDDCDTNAFGWYGNNLQYDEESFGGSSGSGARKNDVVWAIHSHRDTFWQSSNDVRIWPEAFADLEGWIAADTPNSFDFHVLNTRSSTDVQLSGFPLEDLDFLVHNSSEQSGSSFISYIVYISDDATIDSGDTYVTSGSVTHSFQHNSSLRVSVPNAFVPSELPSGQYFVGVLLTQSDANNSNNRTGEFDVHPIQISCTQLNTPVLVAPEDDHPCVPTTLTLNWGSVPGLGVAYELSLRKNSIFGTPDVRLITTSATQTTVENLQNGESYVWSVRASTDCGEFGPWSAPFKFRTVPLDLPVYLQSPADAAKCVPTTATLRWVGTAGSTFYRIRVSENGGPASTYYSSTNELSLSTLQSDSNYQWSVSARDGCGNFYTPSDLWSFRTVVSTAPDAPTPISPVEGELVAATTVLLVHTERFATSYEWSLERVVGPVVVPVDYDIEPGPNDWVVGPLTEGTYRWRARYTQCSATGPEFSPWSAWQDFEVDAQAPTLGGAPQSQNHTVGAWTNQVNALITWEPATDNGSVAGYSWVFDDDPNGTPDQTIDSTQPSAAGVLGDGEDHWFHVVAVDAAGNVSVAQHLGPLLVDTSPPLAPEPVANIAPLTYSNVDKIDVTWPPAVDLGSGVAGYSFAWSTSPSYVLDGTIDTTGLSTSLDPAPEGSRYFYIRAIDALGQASTVVQQRYFVDRTAPHFNNFPPDNWGGLAHNSVVQFFTPIGDFAPPSQVALHHFYSIDGGASWYDAVCGNSLCGSTQLCQATNFQTCNISPGNSNYFWRVPWVPPGSQVLYKIVAYDPAGNSSERISEDSFTVTGISPTETPEIRDFALVGNAPNPFNPRTTIRYRLAARSEVELSIFDLSGRLVRTLVSETQEGPAEYEARWDGIDEQGQTVASGNYFYRLRAGDFVQARRMTLLK